MICLQLNSLHGDFFVAELSTRLLVQAELSTGWLNSLQGDLFLADLWMTCFWLISLHGDLFLVELSIGLSVCNLNSL